jgi:hypothetical protein
VTDAEENRPPPRRTWHPGEPSRNTRGETTSEYDGVGLPTLREWLRYWEGVAAGTIERNPHDEGLDAEDEAWRLRLEIAAREQ